MKNKKALFLTLLGVFGLLSLLSFQALAQGVDLGGGGTAGKFVLHLFQPAQFDYSMGMLSSMFGDFGGIFGKFAVSEPGLLNIMFLKFNEVMMALAIIVVIYVTIMSIINTASEGEILGKKYNTMWTFIRLFLGILLIIPMPVIGYSLIQVIMMWTVIQGVGAADAVWNTVVDYFSGAGSSGTPIIALRPNIGTYANLSKNVLQSTLCLYEGFYQVNNLTPDKVPTLDPSKIGMVFNNIGSPKISGYSFKCWYPSGGGSATNPISPNCDPTTTPPKGAAFVDCGTYSWTVPSDSSSSPSQPQKQGGFTPPPDPTASQQAPAYKAMIKINQKHFAQMLKTFISTAKLVMEDQNATPGNQNPLMNEAISFSLDVQKNVQLPIAQSFSQNTGGGPKHSESKNNIWDSAKDLGWSMAGAYYYNIAKINNFVNSVPDISKYVTTNLPKANASPYWNGSVHGPFDKFLDALDNARDTGGIDYTKAYITGSSSHRWVPGKTNFAGNFIGTFIIKPLITFISPNGTDEGLFPGKSGQTTTNPLIRVQVFGTHIVDVITRAWIGLIAITLGMALIAGLCSSISPLSTMLMAVLKMIITPLMLLCGLLFVSGLTMQVYIPMIPYIIFSFGVIGWLIAVIETIMAAPLVALGITHPSGHEVFGRAEPALMLLTNVFVRPTFMIFGLIAGMSISYIAVDFINFTFSGVINDVGTGIGASSAYGYIQFVAFVVIYVGLLITILNKSFSLITILPDQVLRWIGNTHQFGEYAKGEESIKQAFTGGAGGMKRAGEGYQSATEGFGSAMKGAGDQRRAEKKQATAAKAQLDATNALKVSGESKGGGGESGGGEDGGGEDGGGKGDK